MFSLNVPVKYSNTVYETIRPLYISSRLFGFLNFSITITRPSSNKIYLTKIDLLIFIFHMVVYILCLVFNFYTKSESFLSSSDMLAKLLRYQLIFAVAFCCLMVVVEFIYRISCWNIIESLNDVDLKFLILGKKINNYKQKKFVKRYVVLWLVIGFIFSIYSVAVSLQYSSLLMNILLLTSNSLMNGVYATASTLYSFFIFSIKSRFEALNNYLRDELLRPAKAIYEINSKESRGNVVILAELHDKLTDITGAVNRRYSVQIMSLIATDFVFSVFSMYSVYLSLPFNLLEIQFTVIEIILIIYYHFFFLTIIWLGSSVRSEGAYTGVLIHRKINNCTDRQTVEKLILFSQQLKHQVPIATCKLFTFDWTLLYTIVAATTAYLFIMIQFDSSLIVNSNVLNTTKA